MKLEQLIAEASAAASQLSRVGQFPAAGLIVALVSHLGELNAKVETLQKAVEATLPPPATPESK